MNKTLFDKVHWAKALYFKEIYSYKLKMYKEWTDKSFVIFVKSLYLYSFYNSTTIPNWKILINIYRENQI